MNLHDEMFDKPKEPVITWQGVFPNISYDEYDAWDAIRPTMVKQMSNKPAQKVKYEMDNPREPSAIQIFGQAVHCAVLEPDKFESEFCFKPEDTDRRTKAGKAAYAEWKAATEDKIEVPKPKGLESPEKVISGMVTSLKTNRWASRLLDGAQAEVSIRWTTGGTKLKARLDGIKGGVLLDLKTTNNASPEAFMRTSYKFAYHIQAAMGWDGWEANGNKPERYVFIVVETSPHRTW